MLDAVSRLFCTCRENRCSIGANHRPWKSVVHISLAPFWISYTDIGSVWIVETARSWTHTEFVGFDISHVQMSLDDFDEATQSRISWVHGNLCVLTYSVRFPLAYWLTFLRLSLKPWPFEDNSFDHVRLRNIGSSVPELLWPFVINVSTNTTAFVQREA